MAYKDEPANDEEARRQKRRKPRPRLPADVAELQRELDLEEELADLENPLAKPRKQLRADMERMWGQLRTTTLRNCYRMRDALYRFAPETETPRLNLSIAMIAEQKIMLNQLMFAHARMVPIHLAVANKLREFLEGMPPVRDMSDHDFLEAIREMNKLLTKFQNTNPFSHVGDIESVVAKLIVLLDKNGLTATSARRFGIDMEEELRRYLGDVRAETPDDGIPQVETNAQRRKRQMRQNASAGVDASDETPEGEEEADE